MKYICFFVMCFCLFYFYKLAIIDYLCDINIVGFVYFCNVIIDDDCFLILQYCYKYFELLHFLYISNLNLGSDLLVSIYGWSHFGIVLLKYVILLKKLLIWYKW